MNGQTDDRAQLMVGIAAAIFGAVQKITAGQSPARVVIQAAHDVLDIAGHDHTFDPDHPLRAAVAAAAAGDRGRDGLTDQERDAGMRPADVLGENINTGEGMDRTEETLPVADAPAAQGGSSDFTLPAGVVDRTVPGGYVPPETQRDTSADVARNTDANAAQDAGRQAFNLGEVTDKTRSLATNGGEQQDQAPGDGGALRDQPPGEGGAQQEQTDGGVIQPQDPSDGGRIQPQDPADGGRIDLDRMGVVDAPQQ